MEKTYKRVPFYLELANDIINGLKEGRVVNTTGLKVIKISPLRISPQVIVRMAVEFEDGTLCDYSPTGYEIHDMFYIDSNCNRLFIELPEEEPKHKFKVGDLVEYNELTGNITNINDNGIEITILPVGTIVVKDTENIKIIYDDNGYEFRPFDKVLVRDNSEDKWIPDIFRYYDDNYPKGYPYRCCANDYKYCIPYEGNEHLVGTTDSPE